MEKSATGFFCMLKLFFLFCILSVAGAHAGSSSLKLLSRDLQKQLENKPGHLPELQSPAVNAFYKDHNYKPLWSAADGKLNRAYDLLQVIIHADDEGLKPSDYYFDEIKHYWNSTDPVDVIQLDLLLSAALYAYSNHIYSGRFNPAELDADWHIENQKLDASRLFADVADKESIATLLKELLPPHDGYVRLKKELQRLRKIEQQGGWKKFTSGPTLEPGVQHQQVAQLRHRLIETGGLAEGPLRDLDFFTGELENAVKSYQGRHGLEMDGRVGPQTRRSLNVSVSAKIRQVLINMERWRWMPRKLGVRYLMVNMTGFELYIMENGSPELVMPVIIGKSYRATPSFSGVLSVMEYNPYWTIPDTLVIKDIVPRQISDSTYLKRKSIRVFRGWGKNAVEIDPQTVNWQTLDEESLPYWFRQDPGPINSLGRVKFLFSNPYAVYLHGTPDQHLFERLVRTFSSGCIRVKDPVQLAAYLLNDGSQQMEEEVLANIHLGSNQSVRLPIAVPIYLVYWTAWVDQADNINFRPDIYGRDAALNGLFDH